METADAFRSSRVRSLVVAGLIGACFGAIAVKASLNAFSGPKARPGVSDALSQPVERADIVDRNGELLASSITVYSLYADPRAVWDADETARKLAGIFPDLDVAATAERLADRTRKHVILRRGLTPRERQRVFALALEGLGFEEARSRIYPRRTLAGHVLGFANFEGRGLFGIEYALDKRLAEGGEPVRLTIDSAAQAVIEEELDNAADLYAIQGGAAILMQVETGEVWAMASWPPVDPNRMTDYAKDDPILVNKAMGGVYELGSIFKPLTIAAAFEAGVLFPGDTFDTVSPLEVAGHPVRDTHAGSARMSVTDIIVESSNKGTVQIALRLGPRRLKDFFEGAGLLSAAPIELAGSAAPIPPEKWDDLYLSRVSFGHAISVSPLAFVRAFSALANAGEMVEPRIVMPRAGDKQKPVRVMAAPTAAAVMTMLRETVLRGTGQAADIAGFRVAGKTGTAEKPIDGKYDPDRNITSFAAVFPADDPKFVLLVVLDEPEALPGAGETASLNAAPTVGRIIERIAIGLGIAPEFSGPELDPVAAPLPQRKRERSL